MDLSEVRKREKLIKWRQIFEGLNLKKLREWLGIGVIKENNLENYVLKLYVKRSCLSFSVHVGVDMYILGTLALKNLDDALLVYIYYESNITFEGC